MRAKKTRDERDNPMNTIRTSKASASIVKWLLKAKSKDETRPPLSCVSINGKLETCDGTRLHSAVRILKDEIEDGLYNVTVTGDLVITEPVNETFPDTSKLGFAKPTIRLSINPKYLVDALSGFDGMVSIYICADKLTEDKTVTAPIQITGHSADDTALCAVIMPMYNSKPFADEWNPYN
jgi:hypothetical protein